MEFENFWKIIHILCEVTLRKVTISKLSKDIFDFTLKIKLSFCVGAFHEFLTFSNNRLSCKSFKIECTNLSLHNVPKDFDSHGWILIVASTIGPMYLYRLALPLPYIKVPYKCGFTLHVFCPTQIFFPICPFFGPNC